MAVNLSQLQDGGLTKLMANAIRGQIDEIVGAEIEEAKARIEKRVRAATGQMAANVLERFTFERMGHELVIRVDFSGK